MDSYVSESDQPKQLEHPMFLYQEQVLPLADYYVGQESKLSITISYFFLYNTIKLFLFFGKKFI